MKVTQIYEILNGIVNETLGESVVVAEDLTNLVDVGKAFANLENGYDNYVRKLHDHIGRVVFVNRIYRGRAPSVVMDGWQYGSIMEKIRANLFEATENETWELENGASYDPNIFYAPDVSAKFFNKRVTYEIPVSITQKQVESSFDGITQINAFYSMIQTAIENTMTVQMDALVMRTINNMIGETIYNEFSGGTYTGSSGVRAVNLLYLYNQAHAGATISSAEAAIHTPAFIRFASEIIGNYIDRLKVMSNLFNVGGTSKFTPEDRMHIVMLSEFRRAADIYLQSDTFHDELTRLPNAESVVYWQGSGTSYNFDDTSKIYVSTTGGHSVQIGGVLGCIFDRDALGVSNLDRRVTTNYNAKAEFWNEYHKFDAGYFNDFDENFVVFFAAAS